jgi:hypothetical protein
MCVKLTSISINNINLFYRNPSHAPIKMAMDAKNKKKLVCTWAYIHGS